MNDLTDKEQVEMIKRWWHDYGKILAIAIVIGLIIGFGWRYWRQHKATHAVEASVVYQSMAEAVSKNDETTTMQYANQLLKYYGNTPYATMAAFLSASAAVAHQHYSLALTKLHWVLNNSDIARFRQIARLRIAQILIQQNKLKQALSVLSNIEDKTFMPMINEAMGDIYAEQGKLLDAKKAYAQASLQFLDMNMANPLLTMKLVQPIMKPYSLKTD